MGQRTPAPWSWQEGWQPTTGFGRTMMAALSLGMTYDHQDARQLERLLSCVEYIEVTPETLADWRLEKIGFAPQALAELKNASCHLSVIVHGINLSIGSADRWNET